MDERIPLVTSAGVVAQVWRGGDRALVPVAFLLRLTTVVDLTHAAAKVLGRMLGATRTRDPIDAHIVLLARERGWPVISSDPDDLSAIDPGLAIQAIQPGRGRERGVLAKVLKTGPEFWLNSQMAVDLWRAQQELKGERHRRKSA